MAIYGTLAIRLYANLPTLFTKSLNDIIIWSFSYHSVDGIHYHYHHIVFLNIIIIISHRQGVALLLQQEKIYLTLSLKSHLPIPSR